MATIQFYPGSEYATFVVHGGLSFGEIIQTVGTYYNELRTPLVLWDLSDITYLDLDLVGCHRIADAAREKSWNRAGGKTAFVVTDAVPFATQCLYTAVAMLEDVPIEYSVFKTRQEAMAWFAGSPVTRNPQ